MAKFVRARQLIRAFKQSATPTVLEGLNVDDTWVDTDDHTLYVCTAVDPVTFSTVGGSSGPITASVGTGGSTNDSSSGSGAFVMHTPNYVIPANTLTTNTMLRITAAWTLTTGSVAPGLQLGVYAGNTKLNAPQTASGLTSNWSGRSFSTSWIISGLATPSASSNVHCAPIAPLNAWATNGQLNATAQPVALATNADITLQVASQWANAGTGTNALTLSGFIVEVVKNV